MRLTPTQRQLIRDAVAATFGPSARVRLFGSRTDDQRRGGDIDLLVETDAPLDAPVRQRLALLARLERALGERRIDVVLAHPGDTRPIVAVAREQGVSL